MDESDIVELVKLIREKLVKFVNISTNYTSDGCVNLQLTLNIKNDKELKHITEQLNKL